MIRWIGTLGTGFARPVRNYHSANEAHNTVRNNIFQSPWLMMLGLPVYCDSTAMARGATDSARITAKNLGT
jgi:hypothetical protein